MIVRRFLMWAGMVPPGQRAEGVRALAQGLLYSSMPDDVKREAEAALTSMLDDPSPLVRQALADAFASAKEAPRHCIIALAHDQPEIAALVLERSPLLTDDDLIECVGRGDAATQTAIARRPELSAAVSASLVETACAEALQALAENPGADVPEFSLRSMIKRFGSDGALREALLSRPYLPPCVRADLVFASASALSAFVSDCGWLPSERSARASRETCERVAIDLVVEAGREDPFEGAQMMARHLRVAGKLTPALMLRSLLSADRSLFAAALAELSGLPLVRAAGFVHFHQGGGFAALYKRAGMSADLFPIFQSVLAAQDELGEVEALEKPQLSRRLVGMALRDCGRLHGGGTARVMAMLRQFDAEAAQEEAREIAARLCARPDPLPQLPAPYLEQSIELLALARAS